MRAPRRPPLVRADVLDDLRVRSNAKFRSEQIKHTARILLGLVVGMALYCGPYVWLTQHGFYIPHNDGGSDNRETWYPAYCGKAYMGRTIQEGREPHVTLTAVGVFYLPLIVVDRLTTHKTRFNAW
ncbi:MAG: hypothetical protein JWO95_2864 [Verrucomicrobiales bacterium]|nr:hypothetical protein [Verrucomicrobiales bacterium]